MNSVVFISMIPMRGRKPTTAPPFGAADLYVGSRDAFVTQPLAQYVLNTWPDAIMYYTYNSDNGISYEHIEKTLCPLTAYRLGLVDSFPGSEQFPAATPQARTGPQAMKQPEQGR